MILAYVKWLLAFPAKFELLLVTILILSIVLVAVASGSPSCMTKEEARKKYKTAHLYWHTEHHCWDDTSGRGRHRQPQQRRHYDDPGLTLAKSTPGLPPDPSGNTAQHFGRILVIMLPYETVYWWMWLQGLDRSMVFTPWEYRIAGVFSE